MCFEEAIVVNLPLYAFKIDCFFWIDENLTTMMLEFRFLEFRTKAFVTSFSLISSPIFWPIWLRTSFAWLLLSGGRPWTTKSLLKLSCFSLFISSLAVSRSFFIPRTLPSVFACPGWRSIRCRLFPIALVYSGRFCLIFSHG